MRPCSDSSESWGLWVESGSMALAWCSVWHSSRGAKAFKPSSLLKAVSSRVKIKNLAIPELWLSLVLYWIKLTHPSRPKTTSFCALTLFAAGRNPVRWEQMVALVWRGKRRAKKGRAWGKKCLEKFFRTIQWLSYSLSSFNFMF